MNMNPESEPKKEYGLVELTIEPPRDDKHWMISFSTDSKDVCRAYNYAIETVTKEARLNPFHQVGVTAFDTNEPGYHAWEFWRETNEVELTGLFAKIEEKAQEWLRQWVE